MSMIELHEVASGEWNTPVSFTMESRGVALLLGRNGSGKTTLLNTVAGLERIRKGRIVFRGKNVNKLETRLRVREGIQIALEGRQLFTGLSVRKNLLLGAYVRTDRHNILDDMEAILSMFPVLTQKLDQPVRTLSGGQQTLVNLGRALMGRPKLLLLDEPTLGLDPINTNSLIDGLRRAQNTKGVTTLIAEQSGVLTRAFPNRVLIMDRGLIIFDGTWKAAKEGGHTSLVLA